MENGIETKEIYFWNAVFMAVYLVLLLASILTLRSLGQLPKPIPAFDFIVIGIAVFRLIHLFVFDYITQFIRDYFDRFQAGPGKATADLLSCPWCTGIWMALFVLFIYFLTPYAWYFILAVALAGIGSFIEIIAQRISRK